MDIDMSSLDQVVRRLLAEGKYAIDVEHIENGKNSSRRIFAMDVLHVLSTYECKHYEGTSLDKKLVVFSEGIDANDRHLRIVSRLIDASGEMIVSIMHVDFAETIFSKTAYEIVKDCDNDNKKMSTL